jgi:protein-S-isoprenylcysteine O-methyltransferase Ste14
MFRHIFWIAFFSLFFIRLGISFIMMASGSAISFAFGIAELAMLWLAMTNVKDLQDADYSYRSVFLSLIYLAGAVSALRGNFTLDTIGGIAILLGAALTVGCLFWLRTRFTIAGSTWVSLCDDGPYGLVRHPQNTGRILIVLGLASMAADITTFVLMLFVLVLSVACPFIEESWLSRKKEYSAYMRRVKCRWIPHLI